jgi:hypothetical protein
MIFHRRLLILAYSSGLQIWDCTNLDSIAEMLNEPSTEWGRILHAEVLPNPLVAAGDEFLNSRPLLGMMCGSGISFLPSFVLNMPSQCQTSASGAGFPCIFPFSSQSCQETLNSRHCIIFGKLKCYCHRKVLAFVLLSPPEFLSQSTSSPTSLRILSSCTFVSLSIISSGLSTSTQPQSSSAPANYDTTSPPSTSIDTTDVSAWPHPVFALSHRFLAYACRARHAIAPGQQQLKTPVRAEGVGIQPDLGAMAIRVGGNVLNGMRALGGRALTAARARISDTLPTVPSKPLSRSAPEQETLLKEPDSGPPPAGCHVMILDLASLTSSSPRVPELIVKFLASKHQPISALRFSADGSALMVVPDDGQTVKVFQVRPVPRTLRFVGSAGEQLDEGQNALTVPVGAFLVVGALVLTFPKESAPWHMYNLRRGRTSAVVENLDWAADGRWIAVATQKRTVHIFATNPYGGQPDGQSHVKGRVYNSPKLVSSPSPTEMRLSLFIFPAAIYESSSTRPFAHRPTTSRSIFRSAHLHFHPIQRLFASKTLTPSS